MPDEDYVTLFAAFTIAFCLISMIEGTSAGSVRAPQVEWQRFTEEIADNLAQAEMPAAMATLPPW